MLSRNNYQEKVRRTSNKRDKYSIRKLSIGVASTLIGISFLGFRAHTVHAETTDPASQVTATQTQETSSNKIEVAKATTGQIATEKAAEDGSVNNNVEQPSTNTASNDPNTWKMGDDSKSYDGKEVTKIDSKNFKLKDENGKELNTISVNDDSFEWVNKDGNPVVDAPKNVGTYNVKLTDSAFKKLQKDNPTLTKDPGVVASYTIKQGQATATLRGYDSKKVDGKSVTTDDLNKDDKIYVDLNVPGTTENKYQLKDGDYAWYDANNNALTNAPIDAGTYHAKLTDQGKENITNYIINDLGIGTGKDTINGIEKIVPNIKITFVDSSSLSNNGSSANATFIIYDGKANDTADKGPNGAVWTPAGWTNANPDYVAKNASVTLYPNGKANFDKKNTLPDNSANDLSKPIFFGTDITATIDKNDFKIGNKILLATITATNDYTMDPNSQLPLSVASTENGRAVKAAGTNKIIGRIIVSKLNNGEIDYWLDVTDTDTYGEDVTINDLNDYETGYINSSTDFSELAKLSKNGHQLKTGDTITQTISTVNNTYTQQYKINSIGRGLKNIPDKPTTWASGSRPSMSANYLNPSLNLNKKDLQNIAKKGTTVTANDYYKVFFVQGHNINFDNLNTWERVEISPVDGGEIKFESSDLIKDANGNLVRLDKNNKTAIRLDDNLAVKDVIAQTPDGQSAYSMLKDDSAIVVVKVKASDVKLSDSEIASYVKSSQYYNMQAGRNDRVIKNTQNFYHQIGDQSLRTAIMISLDLKDVDSNDGWANISDITPDSVQALGLQNKGVLYQHGQASAKANVFRTANISYINNETKKNISNEVHTVLIGEKGTTETYSVNIPLGYKFDPKTDLIVAVDSNGNVTKVDNFRTENGKFLFDYTYSKDEKQNKSIRIYLSKIPEAHSIKYTVYDTVTGQTLTSETQLGQVYTFANGFDGSANSNLDTAKKAYDRVLAGYESLGYSSVKTSVDWANLKNNNYTININLGHVVTTVATDSNWPKGMNDNDKVALSKTVTRKISVSGLPYIISSETQTAKFTRTVDVDNVTKKIIKKGDWSLIGNQWKDCSVDNEYVPGGFHIKSVTVDGSGTNYANVTKSQDGKEITGVAGITPTTKDQDVEVHINYLGDPITLSYTYKDADENNKEIEYSTKPIDGTLFTEHDWTTLPEELSNEGYELVPGQSYYFSKAGKQSAIVYLQHKHENVTETKTVIRTINVTDPHTNQITQTTQKATITRTNDVDKVNSSNVKYGNWTTDTTSWESVDIPTVNGYTPSQDSVSAVTVNDQTANSTINITYAANAQTTHVVYKDASGNVIKNDIVSGKTDETVNANSSLPAGWKISDSSVIKVVPEQITFNGASTADTVITIEHAHCAVQPDEAVKQGEKALGGKEINGAHESDLNKTITRTINITDPRTNQTTTTVQSAHFTRTADIDEVTGNVTYGNWTTDTTSWGSVDIPTVNGYTPSNSVSAVTVNDQTTNSTINIKYTANAQSVKIKFVDDDNKDQQVGDAIVKTGVTDQTITDFNNVQIPNHYELATSSNLPTSYQFKADNNSDIVIHLTEKKNQLTDATQLNKTIGRKITINTPGEGATVITQTATFTRTGEYNEVTKKTTYTDWQIKDNGLKEVTVSPIAGYTASQNAVAGITDLTVDTQLKDIAVNYTANAQTTHIVYKDADGKIVKTDTVNGKTDETVDANSTLPAGWVLADSQNSVPKEITFKGEKTADITIQIQHGTTVVSNTNPIAKNGKTVTGQVINGAHESDLNKTITRTINVTDLNGKTTTTTQTVNLHRNATIDNVTGIVTYDAWSTGNWAAVNVNNIAGYTTKVDGNISKQVITNDSADATVNITYDADEQSGKIVYLDTDNNNVEISHTNLSGKTDQAVKISPNVPAGYDLVSDQNIPESVTATAKGIPTVTIYVNHHKIEVKPGDNISGNPDKKPGDGTPNTDVTLSKSITRTINVTDPHTGLKTTVVTLNFERTATIDDVTGNVTYGDWVASHDSKSNFDEFDIPEVAGYTSEIKSGTVDDLKSMTLNQDQINNWINQTIDIGYTANDQTTHVVYKDASGNVIKNDIVNGQTDETVNSNSSLPAGWKITDSSTVPSTITFKGASTADTVITIEHAHRAVQPDEAVKQGEKALSGTEITGAHESDLNKTITRTINVTDPRTNQTTTIAQSAHLTRTADVDEVTGDVTYSDWTTDEKSWSAVNIPTISGYTPNTSVGAVTVNDQTADQVIAVTYTANKQSMTITYVDENDQAVDKGSFIVNGKTGETVETKAEIPAGWVLVDGQINAPSTITFGGEKTNDLVIKIKHAKVMVTADQPKTTDEVLPNNNQMHYPAGVDHDDLNKNVVRRIIINLPNGQVMTIKQIASFMRDAEVDEVNGQIKYGAWKLDKNEMTEYQVPVIDGYHTNIEKVDSENPTVDSQYADILINYVANNVPSPIEPEDNGNLDNNSFDNNDDSQNVIDTNTASDAADNQVEKAFAPQAKHDEGSNVAPQNSQSNPAFAAPAAKHALKNMANKVEAAPLHGDEYPFASAANKKTPNTEIKVAEVKQTVNAESKSNKANDSKQSADALPQTGAKKADNSWLGILLSTLGLSALFVNRKKKKD